MVKQYAFWLAVISLACLAAERVVPWRKEQRLFRPELGQDLFWLVFNGHYLSVLFAGIFRAIEAALAAVFLTVAGTRPDALRVLASLPLAAQIIIVLVAADFIEWGVHNALHRSRQLWRIHRIHHSITVMDWIGNFRFHWMEAFIYGTVKYLPLAILGARWEALLTVAVVSTAIGHLNHANLNISWGPLRYVLNSPRMHIWHHEREMRGKAGVNFAVVFSVWDWLFGTAYMPDAAVQPAALGFRGMGAVPRSLWMRFFLPTVNCRPKPNARSSSDPT